MHLTDYHATVARCQSKLRTPHSTGLMPAIAEGQIYATLKEFKDALREWAIERNFTPHILDSDSHRVRAGCRSAADCPFRIRANYNEKRGNAKVTTVDDVHTCVSTTGQLASQNIKRVEAGKLKFLLEAVPKLIAVDEKTKTDQIIQAVETKYGQTISTRQAQKVKRELCFRAKGACRLCQRTDHSRRDCPQRHISTSDAPIAGNDDLPNDILGHVDGEVDDRSSEEGGERLRKPTHCSVCFKTGHNRKNCPDKLRPNGTQTEDSSSPSDHQGSAPTAFMNNSHQKRVPLDPSLTNGFHPAVQRISRTAQPVIQSRENSSPAVTEFEQGRVAVIGPIRTPQATRLEAARLMQQAAKLMNEAARLNSEAARLTASVANS